VTKSASMLVAAGIGAFFLPRKSKSMFYLVCQFLSIEFRQQKTLLRSGEQGVQKT
jgi:hypothetical protein